MLTQERRSLIERIVRERGSVPIEELVQMTQVSKMTLWRDLTLLDQEGRLRKVHGGATRPDDFEDEPGFFAKSVVNLEAKKAIAQAAIRYVAEGEIILLEGGTTVLQLAEHLTERRVTLLTNGLNTLNVAATSDEELTTISCGGILRKPSLTFVGPEAEHFFSETVADTLFLSGTGFSLERGVTDPNPLEIQVKRAMIHSARRTVVLVDSSKMGMESLKSVISASDIDVLITDNDAPEQLVAQLEDRGVEVVVVTCTNNDA